MKRSAALAATQKEMRLVIVICPLLFLADNLYSQLMVQTHFKPLIDSIGLAWNASTSQFTGDPASRLNEFDEVPKLSGARGIFGRGTRAANESRFDIRRVE